LRVVCGRGETIASRSPTSRLSNVDLPALGRPMRDTNPARYSEGGGAPLPTVVARLAARSSLPPPELDCAGKAGARHVFFMGSGGPSITGRERRRGCRVRGGA